MIDIPKLQELVKLMVDNDLAEVDIKSGEETVTIKRGGVMAPVMQAPPQPVYAPPPAAAPGTPAPVAGGTPPGLVAIESPMVGTFYSAPNPDSPSFVKPGSSITADSVICMIEAMKVFNEIKAEKGGVIEQVLAKNGEAVEFGQKLFLVRPS